MQSHTITNGKQVVVFESMCHVASESFFNDIRDSIRFYKEGGYSYFYEWVKPGTRDEEKRLAEYLGITDLKLAYELLAKLTGGIVQPQTSFVGIVNDDDTNVDLTLGEVVAELDRRGCRKAEKMLPVDALEKLKPGTIAGRFVGWIMRMMLSRKSYGARGKDKGNLKVVRDIRDAVLVKAIVNGPERIIVTYGAAHFQSSFDWLKAIDPAWHIVESWQRKPF